MLVTVGLLVPSQWFAYRSAMGAGGDERFPISAWRDPKYFSSEAQTRTVQPLLRRIIDEIAATEPAAGAGPRPGGGPTNQPSPSPSPSGGKTPLPSASPTPSPTVSASPTPRPSRPSIEIRADHIPAPDGSDSLFYRWRIQIENPADGTWLDDLETLTQVPPGMQRVECGRGVSVDAGSPGGLTSAAAPGITCHAVPPPASEDGHEMRWQESQLGPGWVRVYTFEVRVTAPNGTAIRNHAHLQWRGGSRSTGLCELTVNRQSPKGCVAGPG